MSMERIKVVRESKTLGVWFDAITCDQAIEVLWWNGYLPKGHGWIRHGKISQF